MGLFYDISLLQKGIKNVYKLNSSTEFMTCADKKITEWVYRKSGLKPSKMVSITTTGSYLFKEDGSAELDETKIREKYYVKNEISGIAFSLYINKNWNSVIMLWWSKSGHIYEITDTDINCDDIEFALEPFDPKLYYSQLNYREPHPFKTDKLSFELEVINFDINTTFELQLYSGKESQIPGFIRKTYAFIDDYNKKSLAKDRKYGVVHNSAITFKDNIVYIQIDSGSSGVRFYQLLLEMISDTGCFNKVIIA